MKTVLFDVCHTLYRSNTTYDFLDVYLKNDVDFQRFQARRRSVPARVIARLRSAVGAQDKLRHQAIAFLRGASKEVLADCAREFVNDLQVIEPAMEHLQQAKQSGSRVFLISASLDVLVHAVAENLGVDGYFASELGYGPGGCEGRLTRDLLGNKAPLIQENFESTGLRMVSDNFSDASCLHSVEQFVPVYQKTNVRAQMFWSSKAVQAPILYD